MTVGAASRRRTASGTGRVPLSVLDLVPIASGSSSGEALRRSVDLARRAEAAGYARYWLAEHHLNPGIAGSAPHALIAAIGAATSTIRVGTAATIIGNHSALQVAEAFGTAAGLFGPRFDLGLGRSGVPPKKADGEARAPSVAEAAAPATSPAGLSATRVVDGLVVPAPFVFPLDRARFELQSRLLRRAAADTATFDETVGDLLAFFGGDYRGPAGATVPVHPAEGAGVDVWVHGSTAGESARVAGSRGLPYGANYHVAPAGVLDSVAAYREHFVPGVLDTPRVVVSVDVVVADTPARAHELAAGYDRWVWSIRAGDGAVPYPSPAEAAADPLDVDARRLVQDRLDTRFVGDPTTVVDRLETLQRVTGADELLVTTVTHDHEARARSFDLLAEAWRPAAL